MKTELTIEQSQRLIKLGIDANMASKEMATTISEQEYSDPFHPIFTLTDLLGILPKEITIAMEWHGVEWNVYYVEGYRGSEILSNPELIDAIYSVLIWLYRK